MYLLLIGFQNWQLQSVSEGYIQYNKHCHLCPLENQNKQVQTSLCFWQMFPPTLEFLYVQQTHNWFGLDLTDKPRITNVKIIIMLKYGLCSMMQLIPIMKFNIKTCFIQFLWFFRLKCWFKGQIISRIHLSLPNAYRWKTFNSTILSMP